MPGICGIISETPATGDHFRQMTRALRHEEWYGLDHYRDDFLSLARVHLRTFNPERQPIFNESRSACILMDGKIYDRNQKTSELKRKGYEFPLGNDPEFCLHCYEEYGEQFVRDLNGAFFLVIYDLKRRKLLIANDRYGLLPHYYLLTPDGLVFAPEIKAILRATDGRRSLNEKAVADFLAFGEFFGDETFFQEINIFRPATVLTYEKRRASIEQYWKFEYVSRRDVSEEELAAQLADRFRKVAKMQTRDKQRYCVSLSGGADSRAVIGALDESVRKDVYAFTFGPAGSDEVRIARRTARHAGMRFLHSDITPQLMLENAEEEVWLTEARNFIGVSFTSPAHRTTRGIVDVVLTGFELGMLLGASFSSHKVANSADEDELRKKLLSHRVFSDGDFRSLVRPDRSARWRQLALESFENEFAAAGGDSAGNKCDNFLLRTHVPYVPIGEMLTRVVLEVSFPTMDNEFIDLILGIPFEYRANHRIHRKFMKSLCPELCKIPHLKTMLPISAPLFMWQLGEAYQFGKHRIKQAVTHYSRGHLSLPDRRTYVSFDEWLRTNKEWQSFLTRLLLSEKTLSNQYLNQEYVASLFSEHRRGAANNGRRILYLATFELLLRQFFAS